MKKIYLLSALLFSTLFAQAQIVNIPDANFKAFLVSQFQQPIIDTNNDGEIQLSEAQALTSLQINYNGNNVLYGVQSLTGLEAFTNLTSLHIRFISSMTSFDASVFTHLETLDCENNTNLISLNLTGLTSLRNLDIYYCSRLTNINLNGLTNLQNLNCSYCNLTLLNLTGLSNLLTVNCEMNYGLQSLITTGANSITQLNCSSCALTSLIVNNMTNLSYLDCGFQRNMQTSTITGIASLDFTGLNSLTFLNCTNNNLTSLNIPQMTNLTYLNFNSNQITTFDVSPFVNLTELYCNGNMIGNLNLIPLTQLTRLSCNNTGASSINISTLNNLLNLDCGSNGIGTLDVSNNPNLKQLSCNNDQLTSLSISNLVNLESLSCSGNQLTTLDVSNLHHLRNTRVEENLFTSLDFSQSYITPPNTPYPSVSFSLGNNPNLTYVNVKNGVALNYGSFIANYCPNLQYICSEENSIQSIQHDLQTYAMYTSTPTNVQVNSYCTFVPGGVHNTISGIVTLDNNNNGCDIGDIHPMNFKVKINDGIISGATFSLGDGSYSFFTQTGNFSLTPEFNNSYFAVTPTTNTINFTNLDGSTQTQNYCITANGIHNDVDVTVFPIGIARPGYDASYAITYKNKGNQIMSGDINLTFDDSIFDFVSSNQALSSQSVNMLSWNYSNLLPFESRTIYFTLNLNSPVEIPPVNIDDVLHFAVSINPTSGDETPEDNIFSIAQTVRGSYDPNDKTCLQGNTITPEMVGGYLDYVIRFQNTGSYYAENVVVKDVIDATKFDINSLELIASSHPQTTRVSGNKVEFIFENINLPAQIDNEPASHGFVAFKIKTKNNLVLGNQVQNTANIYFDFNAPVVTNTTSTTVSLLNINETEANSVSMSPIPVKNILQVKALDNITSVEVFDIQGRLLQVVTADDLSTTIDFTGKSKGIYLVKVYTSKGMKVQKIIKE